MIGWLDNADGKLRVGQFISATVDLPTAPDEVSIPESAVLDEGPGSIIFIASNATAQRVTRRMVALVRRGQDLAYVRTHPTEEEMRAGCQPLKAGEYVVTSGVVDLAAALDAAVPGEAPISAEEVH
jgi:cobalt-zinc-cadmium efflux system membrane fusion protein